MSKLPSYHKTTKKASSLSLSLSLVGSPARLSSKSLRPRLRPSRGFTIVELLIVIVVIGILAAISIVAYNGISNNANDAAVKADLRSAMNKIEQYAVTEEVPYRDEDRPTRLSVALQDVRFKKSAYTRLIYCANGANGAYGFGVRTQSGKNFRYNSIEGLQEVAGAFPSSGGGGSTGACSVIAGVSEATWEWGTQSGSSWQSWVR